MSSYFSGNKNHNPFVNIGQSSRISRVPVCPILFVGHWWDAENKTCHKSDGLVRWFNVNCVVGFYIRLSGVSQMCPKAGNKKGGNLLNPA